jgi:hypothetical protein
MDATDLLLMAFAQLEAVAAAVLLVLKRVGLMIAEGAELP